ncbi:hypothetical protein [Paenibacillus kobensis]|uniref:hypothetical protein n=1 Tax=Paenibacillus kobensis TaxID=59841 RepID=UPI000FD79F10|nr:hypothetical protein [Paenibacillus kobensis]
MRKKILIPIAALIVIVAGAGTLGTLNSAKAESTPTSAAWKSDNSVQQQHKGWFKKETSNGQAMKADKTPKQYNFVHKNGKQISKEEIASLLPDGDIDFGDNKLYAVGYYVVDGVPQMDYYFANIDNPNMADIEKYADEVAQDEYSDSQGFTKKKMNKDGQ